MEAKKSGAVAVDTVTSRAMQKSSIFAFFRVQLARAFANEISLFSKYSDELVQWCPLKMDSLRVFEAVTCAKKTIATEREFPYDWSASAAHCGVVLLNGNLNYDHNIQATLMELHTRLNRRSRVAAVLFNPYLKWVFAFLTKLGIREGKLPEVFLTQTALKNLAKLSGYEVTKITPVGFILLPGFDMVNRLLSLIPIVRWFSLGAVAVLRPVKRETRPVTLSIVVPARNERGNIEAAITRLPDFGPQVSLEVIFVEGHSNDGTLEEIQRVVAKYGNETRNGKPLKLAWYLQSGKGKNDAVRLGFAKATGDLLTILDADLTMPPELLPMFTRAYLDGLGDFINGNRLLYPMEGNAMRFLNLLGNIFFARALSWILGDTIEDSLCGTKFFLRDDYRRFVRWRQDFGDFDPFGDFELLYPASHLSLGIFNLPIRYLARTYGTTNILRFRHGLMLLKMTVIGIFRRTGAV